MAILDIIEFFDETGDIMISRVPEDGSGEFRLGSQLIVQESQLGVFFRSGQVCDTFSGGRHTLMAQNLPLLEKVIGLPFGGRSPFRAYVYFVSLKTFPNLGWGTPTPVTFRCKDLRMVTLRAHGAYSMRIQEPRLFMQKIVGTRGIETTFGLEDFFRTIIVGSLNTQISEQMESILDLPSRYRSIAMAVKHAVSGEFEQYGIELVDLIVEAITVPDQVQQMLNRASGIAAQDIEKYKGVAMADAMRDAAQNPGGAGEGIGVGMGLGVGFGMAKQFAEQMGGGGAAAGTPVPPPAAPATPPAPPTPPAAPSTEELSARLAKLKSLFEQGLITEQDFEQQKRRLLDEI